MPLYGPGRREAVDRSMPIFVGLNSFTLDQRRSTPSSGDGRFCFICRNDRFYRTDKAGSECWQRCRNRQSESRNDSSNSTIDEEGRRLISHGDPHCQRRSSGPAVAHIKRTPVFLSSFQLTLRQGILTRLRLCTGRLGDGSATHKTAWQHTDPARQNRSAVICATVDAF